MLASGARLQKSAVGASPLPFQILFDDSTRAQSAYAPTGPRLRERRWETDLLLVALHQDFHDSLNRAKVTVDLEDPALACRMRVEQIRASPGSFCSATRPMERTWAAVHLTSRSDICQDPVMFVLGMPSAMTFARAASSAARGNLANVTRWVPGGRQSLYDVFQRVTCSRRAGIRWKPHAPGLRQRKRVSRASSHRPWRAETSSPQSGGSSTRGSLPPNDSKHWRA